MTLVAQIFRNSMLVKLEETLLGATSNLRSCQELMNTVNMATLNGPELTNLHNIIKMPFENLYVFPLSQASRNATGRSRAWGPNCRGRAKTSIR